MTDTDASQLTPSDDIGDDIAERRRVLSLLIDEHASLKARVADYQRRRWLSLGEELELKTLQRLKLRKKDRMVELQTELQLIETRVGDVTRR
jgi:hypothetical protein